MLTYQSTLRFSHPRVPCSCTFRTIFEEGLSEKREAFFLYVRRIRCAVARRLASTHP